MKTLFIILLLSLCSSAPGYGQDYATVLQAGDNVFALGDTAGALQKFEKALAFVANDEEKKKVLGRLLAVADKHGDTEKVRLLAADILALDSENNWAAFMKAKAEASERGEGDLFSKETIRQVQRRLHYYGYLEYKKDKVDGLWGTKTAKAAENYRRARKLDFVVGIDKDLLRALGVSRDPLMRAGDEFFAQGKIAQAKHYFEQFLKVNKNSWKVLYKLLEIADQESDTKNVNSLANKIISIGHGSFRYKIFRVVTVQNNWAAFIQAKEEAIARGDGDLFSKETIKQVQARLITLGYLTGKATGLWRSETTKAITSFSSDSDLVSGGFIDNSLLVHLGILQGYRLPNIVVQKRYGKPWAGVECESRQDGCEESEGQLLRGTESNKNAGGDYFLSQDDSGMNLWSISQKRLLRSFPFQAIDQAIDPKGRYLALAKNNRIIIYSLPQVEVLHTFPFKGDTTRLRFTPEGSVFLAFTDIDKYLTGWSLPSFDESINITFSHSSFAGMGPSLPPEIYLSQDESTVVLNTNRVPKITSYLGGKDDAYSDFLTAYSLPDGQQLSNTKRFAAGPESRMLWLNQRPSGLLYDEIYLPINEKDIFNVTTGKVISIANLSLSSADTLWSVEGVYWPKNEKDENKLLESENQRPAWIEQTSSSLKIPPQANGGDFAVRLVKTHLEEHQETYALELYERKNLEKVKSLPIAPYTIHKNSGGWIDQNFGVPLFDSSSHYMAIELAMIGGVNSGTSVYLCVWDLKLGKFLFSKFLDHSLGAGGKVDQHRVTFSHDGLKVAYNLVNGVVGVVDTLAGSELLETGGNERRHTVTYMDEVISETIFGKDDQQIFIQKGSELVECWDIDRQQLLTKAYRSPKGDWITITPEGFFDSKDSAQFLSIVDQGIVSDIDQYFDLLYRPDLVREALKGDPDGKLAKARE